MARFEALKRQLQELRTQFSKELEGTREQVAVTQERAATFAPGALSRQQCRRKLFQC